MGPDKWIESRPDEDRKSQLGSGGDRRSQMVCTAGDRRSYTGQTLEPTRRSPTRVKLLGPAGTSREKPDADKQGQRRQKDPAGDEARQIPISDRIRLIQMEPNVVRKRQAGSD